jgi:hypothetical protein
MGIQSLAGPFTGRPRRHPTSPDSRLEALRGPASEGFCRMLGLLTRAFVSAIIPQCLSRHTTPYLYG